MIQLPDDSWIKFLDWILAGFAALLTMIWRNQQKDVANVKKITDEKLAETQKLNEERFANMSNELTHQRHDIRLLFEKIDRYAERSEQRHVEILQAVHSGLNEKADK